MTARYQVLSTDTATSISTIGTTANMINSMTNYNKGSTRFRGKLSPITKALTPIKLLPLSFLYSYSNLILLTPALK